MSGSAAMNLEQTVDWVNPGTTLHIGLKKGSGYLFIGKADEYQKQIDKISERLLNSLKNAEANHFYNIKYYEWNLNSTKDEQAAKELREKISRSKEKIKKIQKEIQNFIPLRNRDVIDFYNRIGMDGVCIILAGIDPVSGAWDLEEYTTGNKGCYDSWGGIGCQLQQ